MKPESSICRVGNAFHDMSPVESGRYGRVALLSRRRRYADNVVLPLVVLFVAYFLAAISFKASAKVEAQEEASGARSCPALVVLRYDDVTPHSNSALERELYAHTDRLGATVMVGVVPMLPSARANALRTPASARDVATKIALLKRYARKGVVEIALHGYRHEDTDVMTAPRSEFAGVAPAQQRIWVGEAARWMKSTLDIEAWAFIPPWNSYDDSTLSALAENGISVISAARSGPVAGASELAFLPATSYPQRLEQAISEFEQAGDCEALLTVVMHPFDFAGGEDMPNFRRDEQISLPQFFESLAMLKARGRVRFLSAQSLLKEGTIDSQRFRENVWLADSALISKKLIPRQLFRYPGSRIYYSTEVAQRIRHKLTITALVYFGLVILPAGLLGIALATRNSRSASVAMWLALGLLVPSSTLLWIGGNYARAMTTLVIGMGISLPAFLRTARMALGNGTGR